MGELIRLSDWQMERKRRVTAESVKRIKHSIERVKQLVKELREDTSSWTQPPSASDGQCGILAYRDGREPAADTSSDKTPS
jgi:hypothetical protein